MASYLWAPDSAHLLFDSNGRLWLYDLKNGTGVQVGFTGSASGDDPSFLPTASRFRLCASTVCQVLHLKEPGLPAMMVAQSTNPSRIC
jgi:dipeptidyl-peptidase-4